MRPPRKVKVGPHEYRVRVDKSGVLMAAERLGQHRMADLRMDVAGGQAPSMLRDTVLHEVMHAVFVGMELSEDDEEKFVSRLTPVLLAVLRDNPKLVEFLTW
jgi:hypothetical protein